MYVRFCVLVQGGVDFFDVHGAGQGILLCAVHFQCVEKVVCLFFVVEGFVFRFGLQQLAGRGQFIRCSVEGGKCCGFIWSTDASELTIQVFDVIERDGALDEQFADAPFNALPMLEIYLIELV